MRLSLTHALLAVSSLAMIVHSFTAQQISRHRRDAKHQENHQQGCYSLITSRTRTLFGSKTDPPSSQKHDDNGKETNALLSKGLYKIVAGIALTTTLWTSLPGAAVKTSISAGGGTTTCVSLTRTPKANAKEMASGSGSRVNKDPESLLRYGLPISNKDVRKLQGILEDIKLDIGTKRKSAALDGVKNAKTLLAKPEKYIASCREPSVCQAAIQNLQTGLDPLALAVKDSQDAFTGSEQERQALDRAYSAQSTVITYLTELEEQMIPAGYTVPVPADYNDLAQLQGRATVEMTLVKKQGGRQTFDVDGQTYKSATLVMVIDGYASPVTAGNFVDLVQRGFYNNMDIQRSDGFVVQTGKPTTSRNDGDPQGYVGTGGKALGNGKNGERLIPLEIFVKGDTGPFYETTIEDEGRGGQATVLPFSSYGAMGWAREEYDPNSGSSQFFWLLFDSDLTPAGKNVLDGRYPCFGYVVEGADFLTDIKEGDLITSAKVTKGLENLVPPKK